MTRGMELIVGLYTAPASSETELFPYRWYVVGSGDLYNLPESGETFGDRFSGLLVCLGVDV